MTGPEGNSEFCFSLTSMSPRGALIRVSVRVVNSSLRLGMLVNDWARSFHTASLRKILRIFWPRKISNDELLKQTKQEDIGTLVTRRRLRWIGHVLRKGNNNIARIAMRWTPEGKRGRGLLEQSSITAGAPLKNWLKIGSVGTISLLPYVPHKHDGQ